MKPHHFHPAAAEEYAAAAQYYASIDTELGVRFYEAIEELVMAVCKRPELFRIFTPPARRHFSRTFPYAIVYLNQSDRVWIIAVMNLHRHPGYWRDRLK